MKNALVLAEFDPQAIPALEALGYSVALAGWGQTHHALTEDTLISLIPDVALLIVEVERVTDRVIAAGQRLEIIATCRSRPVNVDVAAATARGIRVLCTPARNTASVADFALGLLLAVGRNICRADRHLRQRGWYVGDEIPYFHFRGPEVTGKTLGLVGCGNIGRELAHRANAVGMKVLAYDPYLAQDDLGGLARLTSLDEMLVEADFVSLHVPVTEETKGMIGADELSRMKPTAYLINTARAAVVDETALYDALESHRIAGAALDVFWQEPLPADSPWLRLDNVLLTPHLGGAADEVKVHHSAMIVEDLRMLANGESPARLSNPEVSPALLRTNPPQDRLTMGAKPRVILSIEEVARRLDRAGITWAVFAGAAASVYGSPRPVTDVDILVPAAESTRTASLFPEARVERREDGLVEQIKLPDFDILAGLTIMDLDAEMAARLTYHEIAGVIVPIIPPEDNILLKALWGRGPEVGKHDWEDVQEMMAHLPTLDWEYLRWRASTCVPHERIQQVLERLDTLWRQSGKTPESPGMHTP